MKSSTDGGLFGRSWFYVASVTILIVLGGCSRPASGVSPSLRIAVPIDVGSPSVWSEAIAGAPSVGVIVLNPSSGPGESPNPIYAGLVKEAQGKGISVLGYVYTQWASGRVSLKQAEGWIDQYYAWYHVDGIMLDEANDGCDAAPFGFYQALYQYIKAEPRPATVMLNPGKVAGACYASVSDVLLTFENSYVRYLGGYAPTGWTSLYPPSRFFHIVFDVPTAENMQAVLSTAMFRGAGWVFVTDLNDSSGNPYDGLPSYFDQEVAYVGRLNALAPTPTLLPAVLIVGAAAAGSLLVVVASRMKETAC